MRQSHSAALRSAFEAYFAYRGAHPEQVAKPYLYYVDFGLPATEPRGYIFDMDALRLVEGPFTVSHGSGSAPGGTAVPTRFSNRPGSNATSLGLYLTLETYGFRGKAGGRAYRSTGLRLRGLSRRRSTAPPGAVASSCMGRPTSPRGARAAAMGVRRWSSRGRSCCCPCSRADHSSSTSRRAIRTGSRAIPGWTPTEPTQ